MLYMFGFACCCRLFEMDWEQAAYFVFRICLTVRIDVWFNMHTFSNNINSNVPFSWCLFRTIFFLFFLSISFLFPSLFFLVLFSRMEKFLLLIKYFCSEAMKFMTEEGQEPLLMLLLNIVKWTKSESKFRKKEEKKRRADYFGSAHIQTKVKEVWDLLFSSRFSFHVLFAIPCAVSCWYIDVTQNFWIACYLIRSSSLFAYCWARDTIGFWKIHHNRFGF